MDDDIPPMPEGYDRFVDTPCYTHMDGEHKIYTGDFVTYNYEGDENKVKVRKTNGTIEILDYDEFEKQYPGPEVPVCPIKFNDWESFEKYIKENF